jgi:siroheme synthase-like protein
MADSVNELYPVFLKAHQLNILLVGGGPVAEEKLHFLLKSSPKARLRVVASSISEGVKELTKDKEATIRVSERPFREADLEETDLVIAATNDRNTNLHIRKLARRRHCLINVADTPELCDFYLGSIVTKGDLKIAISTNGKSPTFAKRFREVLEESLPDTIPEMLLNLREIRDRLKGDFRVKVDKLNEITAVLTSKP